MTGDAPTGSPDDVAASRPDLEVVPLGDPTPPTCSALVELARPGPFSSRTWELGGYVGVRAGGQLVAMAGRRFRPEGWCEISAVATHPDHRRQGLGEHLVRVVAAGIAERGRRPFCMRRPTTPTPSASTRPWASSTGARSASWPSAPGRRIGRPAVAPHPSATDPADRTTLEGPAVTATAAGMPSRVTVRSHRPESRSTSTRAPSPLHTQARPRRAETDALGRHPDGNGRAHQAADQRAPA